jgi:hypothetical protein
MIMRFLTHQAKAGNKHWEGNLASAGSIIERAIAEPHQTGYRVTRILLAHRQRDVDTGGRVV